MPLSPQSPIAYLVSQYPAVNHTFVLREVRELRRMGFDIRVASIRASDRPFEKLTEEEQEEQRATFYIKTAGAGGVLWSHLKILLTRPGSYVGGLFFALRLAGFHPRATLANLFYFAEAIVFTAWLRREGLTHAHMHFTSTVGLLARRVLPMRTSVTIHGPAEFNAGFYLREKIETFDRVIAISEYGRSQLMLNSDYSQWSKLRVSRLGVDPVLYAPRPFRESPSPFEIINVGRLAAVKAQHVLIAALDRLVREGRDVRLRFVGDGPDREVLELDVAQRALQEHVVFEGWQNADRVRALYQNADIFALSSFAEGIPVVLMEAMAMEIACVSTWITGIPELIRNEVDGLLVPPSSAEELAAALARLMDDRELRRRIGRSGRERILQDYDLNRNTARLADIHRELPA